ncbi:DNA cytosine methyltransferase [Enterobacter cloacae]|uniref:DNA cytosine methyltransferase n=1 Tax=Enterobacter cloacae TaxID=550 RepID=UPI001D9482F5|nr:DNA cytosine methyltransferase [Enterobacter cloacae]CAF3132885.1 Modification methylase HaeIII [Enterobacter cloacae]CAH5470691.1 Modification methylase HaeIII [Enterobacter cloacae]
MLNINTLGFFSGGGGLDLGFSAAGFNIILSSDIDAHSCETLKLNQKKKSYIKEHPVLCEDVRKIDKNTIEGVIGSQQIDFVIGGPPCQSFSVFGRRKGLDDPRGNLVFEYVRLIKELNPRGFLFENVAGLKSIHGGELYKELAKVLSMDGKYKISAHEYEVAEYGVPQFRKRIFFIGSRDGKIIPPMIPTHGNNNGLGLDTLPYNTVQKVIQGLPTPITDWKLDPFVNGHVGRKHSQMIIDRYTSLIYGERDHKTRINKLDPNKPSYTIIVGSDAGGGKGHIHPFEPREVTPRESARIQTFPDWWEFYGTGRHIIRQVGNAVPPLFAALIANHVAKEMFGNESNQTIEDFIEILDLEFLNRVDNRSLQSQNTFEW